MHIKKPGPDLAAVFDNKVSGKDLLIVIIFFVPVLLLRISIDLIPIITKYYPFSILFKNKLLHYKYRKEKALTYYLEQQMTKRKKPFHVEGVDHDRFFITFHGHFLKTQDKTMEKLLADVVETKLKIGEGNVYVRDVDKNKVKILVPTENFNSNK